MTLLHPEIALPSRSLARSRMTTGLLVAGAFHAGLVAWLMHQTFTPSASVEDPAGGIILIAPPPPPPEPRRVLPERRQPAALAPHKVASLYPPPERLDIAPVEHPQSVIETPPIAATVETSKTVDPTPAAAASSAATPAPVVRPPALLRRPSAADLARFYPERALRLGREGRTEVACTIDVSGAPQACRLVSETPADLGFGKAALAIVKTFRFSPQTTDGKVVAGGEVRLPLRWTMND